MNRGQILVAFVVVFVLPQIVMYPFRAQIQQIVPAPTVWQSLVMLLGLLLIFALGIWGWNQKQRVEELNSLSR